MNKFSLQGTKNIKEIKLPTPIVVTTNVSVASFKENFGNETMTEKPNAKRRDMRQTKSFREKTDLNVDTIAITEDEFETSMLDDHLANGRKMVEVLPDGKMSVPMDTTSKFYRL